MNERERERRRWMAQEKELTRLRTQVSQMTQFLKDYGMVWVGTNELDDDHGDTTNTGALSDYNDASIVGQSTSRRDHNNALSRLPGGGQHGAGATRQ